jgi:hypothetical protein
MSHAEITRERVTMRYSKLLATLPVMFCVLSVPAPAQEAARCLDSKLFLETGTLEKIVRHPEAVIEEGGAFWENEPAMVHVKGWSEGTGVRIPYMRWWTRVGQMAELSEEERSDHPLLLMTDSIVAMKDDFLINAVPHLCSFLPEHIDFSIPVYFTAFVPPRSFVSGGIVINVSASYWKENVENILNNLTHEIFHVGYSHMRRERTEVALEDEQLYGMLDYLQNEGMATYVGYEAVSLFPAPDEVDYHLLEDPKDVTRLLEEVNNLFAAVGTVSGEELQRLSWRKGVTDRGYYIVGAHMAQTIDSNLGRAALIGTIAEGPLSFVRTYNSLVSSDMRVHIPVIDAETGETSSVLE